MRRIAWLVTAVAVFGAAGFLALHVIGGGGQPAQARTGHPAKLVAESVQGATTTKTYSMKVAGRARTYQVIAPVKALPKSAPVIVMLAGFGATIAQETSRDQLVPYAAAGRAEVVYPVGLGNSWNAGGCCGYASAHNVNDLAFLKALAAKVNPGKQRRIDVIGYSNGARMAYRVACTDPALFDAYAIVKGVPQAGCGGSRPVTLIQV